LQLGIFGITLFSVNPPAWIMQPLPFWMLTTLDVIALLWSVLILPLSLHPYGMRWGQASLAFLPLWLVLLVAGMTLAQVLPFLLN
ncbi:MAG: hypothetical protein JXA28_06455, partial [Bacteroidetes bacterium]|nr:hypothetical protein [Bacteroidota bacterium]